MYDDMKVFELKELIKDVPDDAVVYCGVRNGRFGIDQAATGVVAKIDEKKFIICSVR